MPFRTNITPDQRVGSPGVSVRNTPCGQTYLRLELEATLEIVAELWTENDLQFY